MSAKVQAIKYFLVSLTAGFIEFLSFTVLVLIFGEAKNTLRIIEFISLALSCIYNYIVNRKVTFKAMDNILRGIIIIAIFYAFFFPFSIWFVPFLVEQGVNPFLTKIIKMGLNFVGEFSVYKWIIFRGYENQSQPEPKPTPTAKANSAL